MPKTYAILENFDAGSISIRYGLKEAVLDKMCVSKGINNCSVYNTETEMMLQVEYIETERPHVLIHRDL